MQATAFVTTWLRKASSSGTPPAGGAAANWTCAANSCSRSSSLAGGQSFEAITVLVNVAANTHREGISLFDILQPAYAGLFSGAIHPTAEGHAIVADHMVRHVRALIGKQEVAETAAR